MGKLPSSVRQRKVHGVDKHTDDDADDDDYDVLEEAVASSSLEGSKQRWLGVIVLLVLVNALLGYVHLQRRTKNGQGLTQESNVVKVLSDKSLEFHIAGHPNGTLVNFHSPDCLHCKKLSPEFESAAKALQKVTDTSLVSVDAALAPLALKRYSVTRFPTLLWFRRGELLRDAPPSVRTTSKILEFVDQSLQPAVIDFASHMEFDEAVPQLRSVLTSESLPVVVGFGRTGVYEALQQAGEKFRGSTAFLFVKEAREEDPYIRAYFRDSAADQDYNATLGLQDLQNWLKPFMEQKAEKRTSNDR